MKNSYRFVAAAGVVVAAGLIFAQNKPATPQQSTRPADEKAIRDAAQALARAFEKGDAQAVANLWTEEGEYIDENAPPIHGRAALAKAYSDFFAKRPEIKVEAKTNSVRFLGPDTAIEEGTCTVNAKERPPNISRYSTLFVRTDGAWKVALLKEWGDDKDTKASLADLAWLIGSWEADNAEVSARTTYDWTESKHFIRARYSIAPKKAGEAASSGVQVIGVHPATGLIHSWTFDGDGGVGEASWTYDGEQWVIDSVGTLASGASSTALNYLARRGDSLFTWRSVQRTVNGAHLPDVPAVKVTRTTK